MSRINEILVMHHSHYDIGYTHPQPALELMQLDFIDQAIRLCELTEHMSDDEKFRWTCEATAPLMRWLDTADPASQEKLRHYLANGQMCVAALPMHTSPLCTEEQLVRMLAPVRELRQRFGIPVRTAINHDINGQSWPITRILLDAGIDFYMMEINVHFGRAPLTRPGYFKWAAPDKRELLVCNGMHYSLFTQFGQTWEGDTDLMAQGFNRFIDRIESEVYPYPFVLLTATNMPLLDNSSPDPDLLTLIGKWNAEDRPQRIKLVTPEMLRDRMLATETPELAVHVGDWTDYWNFGCASSAYETKLNRRAKALLKQAEAMEAAQGSVHARSVDAKEEAWRQALLYDEHTWGAAESITQPDSHMTRTQWMHKAHYAYQADSLANYVAGMQLEKLSGNALQSGPEEGVLLVNASPAHRHHRLFKPESYQTKGREGRYTSVGRLRQDWTMTDPDWTSTVYGTVELPPYSWRIIPYRSLKAQDEPDASILLEDGRIESPYYVMKYDAATGRITGLFDKTRNWEIVDSMSPWSFFQFVRESVDPLYAVEERSTLFHRVPFDCNNDISCWNRDWPAIRTGAVRLLSQQAVPHPSGVTLEQCWEAPGCETLKQQITLFGDRPDIELTAAFMKQDIRTPEAFYFAFPLNLEADWRAHFDTAGCMVELDGEQLPGVSRDWVTVDTLAAVHQPDRGVMLSCPDAPMVMIGGFRFGKESMAIEREERPLLLAWPINNYWDTNFRASQPGPMKVKYMFRPVSAFDAMEARRMGMADCAPVLTTPVAHAECEAEGEFVHVAGDPVLVQHIRLGDGEGEWMVSVHNMTDRATESTIRLPGKTILSAARCNALMEAAGEAEVNAIGAIVRLDVQEAVLLRLRVEEREESRQ